MNHIVEEDDLEEGELNKGRVDEVKESWNAAYGDVRDPGTPRRISFGAEQDIVIDRVRWTPKMFREARLNFASKRGANMPCVRKSV